jgi:hypothetical protein
MDTGSIYSGRIGSWPAPPRAQQPPQGPFPYTHTPVGQWAQTQETAVGAVVQNGGAPAAAGTGAGTRSEPATVTGQTACGPGPTVRIGRAPGRGALVTRRVQVLREPGGRSQAARAGPAARRRHRDRHRSAGGPSRPTSGSGPGQACQWPVPSLPGPAVAEAVTVAATRPGDRGLRVSGCVRPGARRTAAARGRPPVCRQRDRDGRCDVP